MLKYPCIFIIPVYFHLRVLYIITLLICLIKPGFSQEIPSEEIASGKTNNSLEINTENEFCSAYIFRGLVVEKNFVYQPAVYFWYNLPCNDNRFGTGVWLNFRINGGSDNVIVNDGQIPYNEDQNSEKKFVLSETDIYLMHEAEFKDLYIKNTAVFYLFNGNDEFENSGEYILNTSYGFNNFNVSGEFAVDLIANPGAFIFTHSASYEKAITKKVSFNSAISLIWASSKYNLINAGISKTAINSAGIEFSVLYQPNPKIYSKLRYQYNSYIDNEIRNYLGTENSSWGITAGFNF